MWFQLRSPELAEDFERLMTEDRDIVGGSLDTVSDWRLTRPADVPGQSIGQADYVLIAEIVEVERFEQQASEHVQRLADDLAHLASSPGDARRASRPLKSAVGGERDQTRPRAGHVRGRDYLDSAPQPTDYLRPVASNIGSVSRRHPSTSIRTVGPRMWVGWMPVIAGSAARRA
jgi:hypothetical protein